MEKILFVGLGNPGNKYLLSRHNLGFIVLDYLASSMNIKINSHKFYSLVGSIKKRMQYLILIKPQTYMNLSGKAVIKFIRHYNITMQNLIVIHDDLDIKLNTIKIKQGGSSGGHKGLISIINEIGNINFIRIRIGIGKPIHKDHVNQYVLDKIFNSEQESKNSTIIMKATNILHAILNFGVDKAMNIYNK